jgi:hypothetical protein
MTQASRAATMKYRLEGGVSEAGFRDCLDRGGRLLILCVEDARPGRGNFQGGWKFYALNPEKNKWTALNLFRPQRGVNPPRVIRTVNGVCSLLKDLGFPAGIIPFGVGSGVETSKAGDMRFSDSVLFD